MYVLQLIKEFGTGSRFKEVKLLKDMSCSNVMVSDVHE